MTTIEALNATGVVYAVRDGSAHVSVHPIGDIGRLVQCGNFINLDAGGCFGCYKVGRVT